MPAQVLAPVSLAQAEAILQHAADTQYRTAQAGEIASQRSVLTAKNASLSATIDKTKAEQKDSLVKFSSSGLGGLTNAKLAMYGAGGTKNIRQMKDEADAKFAERQSKEAALRAAATTTANSSSNLATMTDKTTEAMSQTMGPQADMHAADIASKQAELTETVAKNAHEGFKSSREQAQKSWESVNDFVKGGIDRAAQTINKIFA